MSSWKSWINNDEAVNILVQNVVVGSETGQSRDFLTDITITKKHEAVIVGNDDKVSTFRSYYGITREGMHVRASVKTFKNEDYHNLLWSPTAGTQLTQFDIFDASMKYKGHY